VDGVAKRSIVCADIGCADIGCADIGCADIGCADIATSNAGVGSAGRSASQAPTTPALIIGGRSQAKIDQLADF
jgi:hypothetical protein